jgi:S-adenosylmethionine hydrolase
MRDQVEWSRVDAEARICEVFHDAKAGEPQIVRDSGGKFEIRFIADDAAEPVGQYLARGGPDED